MASAGLSLDRGLLPRLARALTALLGLGDVLAAACRAAADLGPDCFALVGWCRTAGWCSGPPPGASRRPSLLCHAARTAPGPTLSPRERQVLELLARGHTNREVGSRLVLSVKTVETHRARLSDKLGLHTRADLVRLAFDLGLFKR